METIGTALTAAETGHLVFATLHTQDAPQTVDRIIDVFPPAQQGQIRAQLAIGLQGDRHPDAAADRRRRRPLRRRRGAGADAGRPQPHPRGQDAPDLLADPDRRRAGDADDGRLAGRPRPRRPDHAWPAGRDALVAARRSCAASCRAAPRPSWPPDGRRASGPTRRSTSPASRPRARSRATSKQAVAEQLQGAQGLKVVDARREEARFKRRHRRSFKRVKAAGADGHDAPAGDDGHLGHDAPAGVLRARGADREQAAARRPSARCARTSRPACAFSRGAGASTRRSSRRSTSRWSAPARPAACSRQSLDRVADQLEKDDALRRQVKSRDGLPDRRAVVRAAAC